MRNVIITLALLIGFIVIIAEGIIITTDAPNCEILENACGKDSYFDLVRQDSVFYTIKNEDTIFYTHREIEIESLVIITADVTLEYGSSNTVTPTSERVIIDKFRIYSGRIEKRILDTLYEWYQVVEVITSESPAFNTIIINNILDEEMTIKQYEMFIRQSRRVFESDSILIKEQERYKKQLENNEITKDDYERYMRHWEKLIDGEIRVLKVRIKSSLQNRNLVNNKIGGKTDE